MPRLPRIEFEGAIYHVMARGNHRAKIVFSDGDRRVFIDTFAEAVGKTGWRPYCWVLMNNHYHLVFQTPQPNLVAGMTWFQQTFTQRINARNRLRGHLFAGRYKAIPVENDELTGSRYRSDYLTNLIQYVHLNPGRAGLVDGNEKPILDYQWSSLAQWYSVAPSKRLSGTKVKEGLELLGYKDSVAGRRNYIAELDETIQAEGSEELGMEMPSDQTLQSTLERGWYWGSQYFKEQLLDRFGDAIDQKLKGKGEGLSEMGHDHSEHRAKEILELAKSHFGMGDTDLCTMIRGDLRRPAIAAALTRQTTLSQTRIAEILNMKNAANVSQQIRRFNNNKTQDRKIKQFIRKSGIGT